MSITRGFVLIATLLLIAGATRTAAAQDPVRIAAVRTILAEAQSLDRRVTLRPRLADLMRLRRSAAVGIASLIQPPALRTRLLSGLLDFAADEHESALLRPAFADSFEAFYETETRRDEVVKNRAVSCWIGLPACIAALLYLVYTSSI